RYATIPVHSSPQRVNADNDPELNLALRGWVPFDGFLQKVGLGGETDPHAPKLPTLFDQWRDVQDFVAVYRVREWNWNCSCAGGLISNPEVTLLGMPAQPGEVLRVPDRTQGDIGGGYRVMVLHATPTSLLLKYTREDDIIG